MGIYDREYYRREGPSLLGSLTEHGTVCKWLIGINVACFVLQILTRQPVQMVEIHGRELPIGGGSWFTDWFVLDTQSVLQGEVWRLLTYAFLHGNLVHIFFNMAFLWWFGSDVEDLYGPREFLAFYLVAAVLGGIAFQLAWMLRIDLEATHCLGASGAVTAVLVLCAVHYPTRMVLLFFLIPVPIWLFVLFEVAQDLFGFLGGGAGNTAVSVHLGGAAFAFVYYKRHWRLLDLWATMRGWQRPRLNRPRLRVYREEPEHPVPVAAPSAAEVDEQLEAKLDAVLEKVARSGQDSLTDSERQILMRASEVYKRRRT